MVALCGTLTANLGDVAHPENIMTKVTRDEAAAVILTSGGAIKARAVILTLPLCLAIALGYDPSLPQWR